MTSKPYVLDSKLPYSANPNIEEHITSIRFITVSAFLCACVCVANSACL